MKPKNNEERKKAFVKYLLSGLLLLGVFGYGIYTLSFIQKDVNTNLSSSNSEIESLMAFIDKADNLVSNLDKATSQVNKNKFSVELNQHILEQKPNFVSTATLFSRIEDTYRSLIKSKEVLVTIGEESKLNCEEELKKYEEQIEDLNKQLEKVEGNQEDAGKDLRIIKSGLERVANDLAVIGNDFASRDWCKGLGKQGKESYKSELKDKIAMMKNEILKQASSL